MVIDEGRLSQAILVDALDAYFVAHERDEPRHCRKDVAP
jgi:hypothetical protein